MSRTTLELNDELLATVQGILGTRTIKDTVHRALEEVARHDAAARHLGWLAGDEHDLRNADVMRQAWE